LKNPNFEFKQLKCSELKTIVEFDCIFHLAALPRIQPSYIDIKEHLNANVNESIHIVELMISESHFPKFIYSSSSAIYGTPEQIPTTEDAKINCLSPYAFQKYEVEMYLELLSKRYNRLDYACLRYFNPYGPRSYNSKNPLNAYSSVVGIFLNQAKNKLPLQITGDGLQQRDFIHVRDIVRANYYSALIEGQINSSINLGMGETLSVLDLAKKISTNIKFIEKREGESDITLADITKAKKVLNWKPEISLNEYIKSQI
jgi:UDP-glucose 4-epimerase